MPILAGCSTSVYDNMLSGGGKVIIFSLRVLVRIDYIYIYMISCEVLYFTKCLSSLIS